MPKGSTYDLDASPQDNDSVVAVRNSPLGTVRFKLSALASYLAGKIPIGWQTISATLTYSSWDSTNATGVLTSDTDLTSIISVGMKMYITQSSTVKYFFVTYIDATTIKGYFGTDYTLTSATVSSPYYSALKAPYGFPLDPNKWTQSVTSTNTSQALGAAAYASAGISLSIPIGLWKIGGQLSGAATRTTGTGVAWGGGLSETTSGITSGYERTWGSSQVGSTTASNHASGETLNPTMVKSYSSPTTVYWVTFSQAAGTLFLYPAPGQHYIEAVCAYL